MRSSPNLQVHSKHLLCGNIFVVEPIVNRILMQPLATLSLIPANCSRLVLENTIMVQFIRHNRAKIRNWIDCSNLPSTPSLILAWQTLEKAEVLTTEDGDYQSLMVDEVCLLVSDFCLTCRAFKRHSSSFFTRTTITRVWTSWAALRTSLSSPLRLTSRNCKN